MPAKRSKKSPISGVAAQACILSFSLALTLGCVAPVDSDPTEKIERKALECSIASLDELGPVDVAFAFDNSASTVYPPGFDVDEDGIIGEFRASEFTDRDDSWLGVQVAAARTLIRNASGNDMRFSIISFSGPPFVSRQTRNTKAVGDRDARIRAAMTADLTVLEDALDAALNYGSRGSAHFYAGMRRASQSLIEARVPDRESKRVVLFTSNSPGPTFHNHSGLIEGAFSSRMHVAVREAKRHRIVFNTFGLTEEANSWHRLSLGLMAPLTRGTYQVVDDPSELYCHFVNSLVPRARDRSR